mgnify:CR=1 FL=1
MITLEQVKEATGTFLSEKWQTPVEVAEVERIGNVRDRDEKVLPVVWVDGS